MTGEQAGRARKAGAVLIALGILHTLATLGGAGGVVVEMIGDGWWRTADISAEADPMRIAVFWSLQFGALLALVGWVLLDAGRGSAVPGRAWAVVLAAVCLAGGVAVPAGGFWFGLGLMVWVLIRSGRDPS